jgi:hypothetical protein
MVREKDQVIQSSPVEITVSPLVIDDIASIFCPRSDQWSSIFYSAGSLFIRETFTNVPKGGSSIRVENKPIKMPVTSLATSIQANVRENKGRWYACLSGSVLTGTRFWGLPTTQIQEYDTHLEHPRLINPGYQFTDQSSLFCVAGSDKGEAMIKGFRIGIDGTVREQFALKIGGKVSEKWWVRYSSLTENSGTISFLWQIPGKDKTVIMRGGINFASKKPEPIASFSSIHGQILSMELAPLAERSIDPGCSILFRPSGENDLHGMHIDWQTPSKTSSVTIEPAPGPVDRWAIPAGTLNATPIIALSKEYVLWSQGGVDKQWKALVHLDDAVEYSRLVAIKDGTFWAEWITKSRGFCFGLLELGESSDNEEREIQ